MAVVSTQPKVYPIRADSWGHLDLLDYHGVTILRSLYADNSRQVHNCRDAVREEIALTSVAELRTLRNALNDILKQYDGEVPCPSK